jgi:hypothetical protein
MLHRDSGLNRFFGTVVVVVMVVVVVVVVDMVGSCRYIE